MDWVNLQRLPGNSLPYPRYATEGSAGLDLAACLTRPCYEIRPDEKEPQHAVTKRKFLTLSDGFRHYLNDEIVGYESAVLRLEPNEIVMVPLGWHTRFDESLVMKVYPRSGQSLRGICLANGVAVIDSDYNDLEVFALLTNRSNAPQLIRHGERIVQAILEPFARVVVTNGDNGPAVRRSGGFGSTKS